MCGNGIFSTSHYKVIQHKRAFLGESPEPKLRPCSRNENSENENKISHRQINKTVSIDLNIHRGETLNTKQKKIMVRNNFPNFYSANSTFLKFSISGAILQIHESTIFFKNLAKHRAAKNQICGILFENKEITNYVEIIKLLIY